MRIDLPALAARANPGRRKRTTTFRDIIPPATLATDLYRAVYLPVVSTWARTADRVIAEYERTLSSMTTDAPSDITSILDQAEAELTRLVLLLRPALSDWTLRVERYFRSRWIGAVLAASKVDLTTLLSVDDVRETLETILGWNVDLVQDVSRQTRQRISNAVFDGLRARAPAREVARQIREATGLARDRSQRIAADQLQKLTASLATERRRQAGLSTYMWMHSRKKHPRVEHEHRDGHLFSDDPAMVGQVVEGKTVEAQPERGDQVGQKPYCGCRERAVLLFQ